MVKKWFNISMAVVVSTMTMVSCSSDDSSNDANSNSYSIPTTYVFEREGVSTVSYSGQTDRKDHLAQMTAYMKTGNNGDQVDAQQLKDMYSNKGDNGNGHFSFTSTKQLKNKTVEGESGSTAASFDSYMDLLAAASQSTTPGSAGQAGVVGGSNGEKGPYLFDANGIEYTQLIEKGLMGAVFYYQITNVYLGDDKMNVDNSAVVDQEDGKLYTKMEHHWDEAFGYFSDVVDFPTNGTDRHLAKYCNTVDGVLGSNKLIMDAFLKGRAAITNTDLTTRDAQREIIRTELEKVMAGAGVHYLNSAISNFSINSNRNHALSEAVAFINGLKYGYQPTMTTAEVDDVLAKVGNDFYNVTSADLVAARDMVATKFGWDDNKESF